LTRTQRHIEENRKGDACITVRDAEGHLCPGVPVSIEQESHEFHFGCVVSDLGALSSADRQRYEERLAEVFNYFVPAEQPALPGQNVLRLDLTERVHLGLLRLRLDQLAASGQPLQVHVCGEAVGMSEATESTDSNDRAVGQRLADLYTLCFAQPSVSGVFWNGFADGEQGARGGGLLRRNFAPRYAHKVLQKLIHVIWHRCGGPVSLPGFFRRLPRRVGSDRIRGARGDLLLAPSRHTGLTRHPSPSAKRGLGRSPRLALGLGQNLAHYLYDLH